jgi:hypothetical protein
MLGDVDFGADDMIDVSRGRRATAQHCDLTERLLEEDNRERVFAPVLRIVEFLETERAAIRIAPPQKTDLSIVFLMGFTVR